MNSPLGALGSFADTQNHLLIVIDTEEQLASITSKSRSTVTLALGRCQYKTRKLGKVKLLEHFTSFAVDFNDLRINSGGLRNEVESSFAFLFLELKGDTTDRTLSDTGHEMGDKASHLVAKTL